MWMNYCLLGLGTLILILMFAIYLKMTLSGKPLSTAETNGKLTAMLSAQAELNKDIGKELKHAGWFQTRKWKKELGSELYDFYIKKAD